MKKLVLATLLASLGAIAAPSYADDGTSFNLGLVSDYRYRGISQTRLKPALQGGADFTKGGFYAGTWLSTIKWTKDAGGSGDLEWDIYGGYKGEISKDVGYDVGLLAYVYPSNGLSPSANTTELYGALSFGPVTAKYSHSLTNLFGFASSKNSGYLDLTGTFEVAKDLNLITHIGHQTVKKNSAASYSDYLIGLSYDAYGLNFTGSIIKASTSVYLGPTGQNLGKTALVVGVKKSF
jgi:uncharacterized protein (TIGR02001 family)